ncbi:MAG: hypothetical protein IH831_07530, partial [Planctomycetes bacterium]|nr:hypothetical protein [Planctomycetota bacterium]
MCKTLATNVCSTQRIWPAMRLALFVASWFSLSVVAEAGYLDDIGYTKLSTTLGNQMLTGQGVFISQVEAGSGNTNTYFPDPNHNQFDASFDPFGMDQTFVNGSAGAHANPDISNHATNIGRSFYGNFGVARGANTVVIYEANDYIDDFLNCGSSGCGSTAPDAPTFIDPSDGQQKTYVVQNHSWAGSLGLSSDRAALRKVDYLIDEYDVTMAVGVNNGTPGDPHPNPFNLLGHSFNAIAVGRTDGLHSIDATSLTGYGPGRANPVIVAPLGTTSSSTAVVSGAATMSHQVLAGTDGTRSETMRAVLLAGATKQEFDGYVDPVTSLVDAWNRSVSQPLDNIFGAGELNVFNSYLITQGGQFAGSTSTPTPVDSYGWDYQEVTAASDRKYEIEIPEGSTAAELSIILSWNVDINLAFNGQTLADLNLTLRDDMGTIVDQSTSGVDSIEHIYIGANQAVTHLDPGTYTLEVSTNLSRDYGIAWRTTTLFDEASADFDEDGDVDGKDFLTWQRGLGILLGAAHGDGDADGDGDVDLADLLHFHLDPGNNLGLPIDPNDATEMEDRFLGFYVAGDSDDVTEVDRASLYPRHRNFMGFDGHKSYDMALRFEVEGVERGEKFAFARIVLPGGERGEVSSAVNLRIRGIGLDRCEPYSQEQRPSTMPK